MKKLNQVGDTIVEALIATVIIGLAIGLAYGIASRSLRSAQQSQERLEALKLAEGQIEAMKAKVAEDGDKADIFATASTFCLGGVNGITKVPLVTPPPDEVAQDNLGPANYPSCITGTDSRYHLAVRRVQVGDGQRYQFTVTARWFGIGDSPKQEVKIEYRLHP